MFGEANMMAEFVICSSPFALRVFWKSISGNTSQAFARNCACHKKKKKLLHYHETCVQTAVHLQQVLGVFRTWKLREKTGKRKLMRLFWCELGYKLSFMRLFRFKLNKKSTKGRIKSSPSFISANRALGLYLLVSKEQPWLPLMFQQRARLQMIASVCWTIKE
jgi:hypothetical protein